MHKFRLVPMLPRLFAAPQEKFLVIPAKSGAQSALIQLTNPDSGIRRSDARLKNYAPFQSARVRTWVNLYSSVRPRR